MEESDPDRITPAPAKSGAIVRPCVSPLSRSTSAVAISASSISPASSKQAPSSSSSAVLRPENQGTVEDHNARSRLLRLPLEILSLVFDFCDWPSARALRQSCTHLRSYFTVLETIRKTRTHRAYLLHGDDGSFPAPCYGCVRILPQHGFPCDGPLQRNWEYRHLGYEGRRCTECLLASNKVPIGVSYFLRGTRYVYCVGCEKHRAWIGRFGSLEPGRFCGRCRDIRTFWRGCKKTVRSLQFWVGVMGAATVVFSTMAWLTIVRLWRGHQPYDQSVLSWAFFSAAHTLAVQLFYWSLVLTKLLTRNNPRGLPHRISRAFLRSDSAVFETGIEWVMIVASMCMPFAVTHVATVPLLGWSTLSWAAAVLATLLRWSDGP